MRPENCAICLSVPEGELSVRRLTGSLRLFELLVALRAVSPNGKLLKTWSILYAQYLNAVWARRCKGKGDGRGDLFEAMLRKIEDGKIPEESLDGSLGAEAEIFEEWISAEFTDLDLLPIESVQRGSYEFILQAVNLTAIFGLQDVSLVKDIIQWTTAELRMLIRDDDAENHSVKSGDASIRLTPELLRAVKYYDDVTLSEERTSEKTVLRVKLIKHNPQSLRREA